MDKQLTDFIDQELLPIEPTIRPFTRNYQRNRPILAKSMHIGKRADLVNVQFQEIPISSFGLDTDHLKPQTAGKDNNSFRKKQSSKQNFSPQSSKIQTAISQSKSQAVYRSKLISQQTQRAKNLTQVSRDLQKIIDCLGYSEKPLKLLRNSPVPSIQQSIRTSTIQKLRSKPCSPEPTLKPLEQDDPVVLYEKIRWANKLVRKNKSTEQRYRKNHQPRFFIEESQIL